MDTTLDAYLKAALKALHAGIPQDALAALRPALERAVAAADDEAEMLVQGLLAPAHQHSGDAASALAAAQRAHVLAKALGDADSVAYYGRLADALAAGPDAMRELDALLDAAWAALEAGDPARAAATLEPEVARARALGPGAEASLSGLLAQALSQSGRIRDARAHAARALAIAEALGDAGARGHFGELVALLGSPAVDVQVACEEAGRHLEQHRPDAAIALLEVACDEAAAADLPGPEASARGLLAQALLAAGRRAEAREQAHIALEVARRVGDEAAVQGLVGLAEALDGFPAPTATDRAATDRERLPVAKPEPSEPN